MADLSGDDRARYVQGMFGRIAGRYDLMNRLMTGGMDARWRQILLDMAMLEPGMRLLDLGTGTGDIAIAARDCGVEVVAGDFTLEMMRVGQTRSHTGHIRWVGADALNLPFPDEHFDAVVSGYLLRNVGDLMRGLAEQYRVLKPGGRFVTLDSTPPPNNLLRPFINLHLHVVIPTLGKLISGEREAYTYLPDSTEGFKRAEDLADALTAAGFEDAGFQRLMFGTMAVHWGSKPA